VSAPRTYAAAGVNEAAAADAVARIARAAAATRTPAVLGGIGGFGGLVRFDPTTHPDPVLVTSTDGVGTKLKIAVALGRHDSVGVDLVHQSVNDIVAIGADPLFFVDYLAVGRLQPAVVEEIVAGVAAACAAVGIPLVAGETAQLTDVFAAEDDYDLAGFVVGVVSRPDVIDGARVEVGDAVLGLPSTGLHTNGYTLARRILPPDTWSRPMPAGDRTIGEALLEPHRSYLDEVRALRRAVRAAGGDIGAVAHITGGGWEGNVPRTLPEGIGVEIDTGAWPVPPIFTLLQQAGDIADEEMVRTFNVGIGMTVVVPARHADAALDAVPDACRIGRTIRASEGEPRVRFE
jgi:phosphoribosylformylglycinamidine cyclo-ligase